MAVNHKTKLAIALAGALMGVMKVSDAYAQQGCWNGKNFWYGDARLCAKDYGSTCVVCTN
jgi:hypothetical protein